MGRPKNPKGISKGVLIGTRFSPKESDDLHEAIKASRKDKSQWIRATLLNAANPQKYRIMKVKLTIGELEELKKQAPSSASDGGYQNFLVKLQYRVDDESGELELDDEDMSKIHRYAFEYKNGGWQTRLKKIFSRTLGDDLSGLQ